MKKLVVFICCVFIAFSSLLAKDVVVGAERLDQYLPLLKGKSVGLVVNQTSIVGKTHLLDTLLSLGIDVQLVFAPEHGFRGTADAGEHVKNGVDPKTKTAIVSLYGDNKKPKPGQLKDLEIVIFDIQDVGVRFYTYISTLQYVMEACAENKKPGEYANMLNGEKWLTNKLQCKTTVIPCLNYDHKTFYSLPVKPSPNLPNMAAIYLYPSLCFFEGTNSVSLGRGTDKPFQIYGSDVFPASLPFSFTPKSVDGAKNPPLLNKNCFGYDLSAIPLDTLQNQKFTLSYILNAYALTKDKTTFFNDFFIKLAGKANLKDKIQKGISEKNIKGTWKPELAKFKVIRKRYLLYPDFN